MEIEFNPSRYREVGANQVDRRAPVQPANTAAPHERAQALEQSLRDASQVRPEMVERARQAVNDAGYPPQEMMERIATLLAMHIKN